MDSIGVIGGLSALAQPTRLEAFRVLVRREPEGIPAGELASILGVPQNTMSAHLTILVRAGLIFGERQGRNILYRADLKTFRDVMLYLLKDCCGGRPELCTPLIDDLQPCRPAPEI